MGRRNGDCLGPAVLPSSPHKRPDRLIPRPDQVHCDHYARFETHSLLRSAAVGIRQWNPLELTWADCGQILQAVDPVGPGFLEARSLLHWSHSAPIPCNRGTGRFCAGRAEIRLPGPARESRSGCESAARLQSPQRFSKKVVPGPSLKGRLSSGLLHPT
jgi:hypothetical protein